MTCYVTAYYFRKMIKTKAKLEQRYVGNLEQRTI